MKGAKVYIGARSESRASEAIQKIRAQNPKGSVEWLKLDLQDLSSVKSAAQTFSDKEGKLDVLYNNAGVMAPPYQLTKDGIEGQIQTNHIGPFLLTNLLLPKLEKSNDPRIVITSSTAHTMFSPKEESFSSLEEINKEHGSTWSRYGQSKLANVLFAIELADRHPKIMTNACHPGLIATELSRGTGQSYGNLAQKAFDASMWLGSSVVGAALEPPQGALTQLYLGTAQEIRSQQIKGKYYSPIAIEKQPQKGANKEQAAKLWKTSEAILEEKGFSLTL